MTKPNVFIIESLHFKDEEHKLQEGELLSKILHLSGKDSIYYYIRTQRELEAVLEIFMDSDYRYLHLSCHGNSTAMYTTLDEIPFSKLGKLLRPVLNNKRLFLSACSMANASLAKELVWDSRCLSVMEPA